MSQLMFDRIRTEIKNFLTGMLLVPWVWIWGFFVILLGTYAFGLALGIFTGDETFRFSSEFIRPMTVWTTAFGFLLGNYTIYYFTRYSLLRLRPILFIVSVFTFSIFFLIYLPFLIRLITWD